MENCKSIIKKKGKKHDDLAFLAKTELNCIKSFISKCFINSCVMHDDFLLIDYALRKYGYMNEEINSHKTS